MLQKKPTNSDAQPELLRASLFWLAVILFVFVPIVNNLALQTAAISISGDIAYESLYPILSEAVNVIGSVSAYAGIGMLAVSIAYFGVKKSKGVVILAYSSHAVIFIASMLSYRISGELQYGTAAFIFGIDAMVNLLFYAIITVALLLVRFLKQKKRLALHPSLKGRIFGIGGMFTYIHASVGLYLVAQLAIKFYEMMSAFLDPSLGPPINTQERIYWILQYVIPAIYGAIGYFTALTLCYLCEHWYKKFKTPKANVSKKAEKQIVGR